MGCRVELHRLVQRRWCSGSALLEVAELEVRCSKVKVTVNAQGSSSGDASGASAKAVPAPAPGTGEGNHERHKVTGGSGCLKLHLRVPLR